MRGLEKKDVQVEWVSFFHCGFDPSFNEEGNVYRGPQYDINRFSLERDEYIEEEQESRIPPDSPIQTVERAISQIALAIFGDEELCQLIGACKRAEEELSKQFFLGFGVARDNLDEQEKEAAQILSQRALQYLIKPKEDAFLVALGDLYAKFYTDHAKIRRFPREVLEVFYAASRPQNEEWFQRGVKNADLSRNGAKMGGLEFVPKRGEVGEKAAIIRQDSFKCNPLMWEAAEKLIRIIRELRTCLREVPSQDALERFSAAELESRVVPLKVVVKKVQEAWQFFVVSDPILSRCQGLHSQFAFFHPWYESLKNESDIPYLAHLQEEYNKEMPSLLDRAEEMRNVQYELAEEKQRMEEERNARYIQLKKRPQAQPPKKMESAYKDDIWSVYCKKVEIAEEESRCIANRSRYIGGEIDRIIELLDIKYKSIRKSLETSTFHTYMCSLAMDGDLKEYPLSFVPSDVDRFEIAKLKLVGSLGELFISCPNYSEKELYVEVFDAITQMIPEQEKGKELYSLLGEIVVKFPAEDVWVVVDFLSRWESGKIGSFLQLFHSLFSHNFDKAGSAASKEQLLACFFLLARENLDREKVEAIETLLASYREKRLISPFLDLIAMMPLGEWLNVAFPIEEFFSDGIVGIEEKIISAVCGNEDGEKLSTKVSQHLTDLISCPYLPLVKKGIAHFGALLTAKKIPCTPEQLRVFNRVMMLIKPSELQKSNSPYRVYRQLVLQQYRTPVALPDERHAISILDDGVKKKMTVWKVQNLRSSSRRKLEATFENRKRSQHHEREAVYQFSGFIFDCIQETMCDCFNDPKLIEKLSGNYAVNHLELHKSYLISKWHRSVGLLFGFPTFQFDIFDAPLHSKLVAADEQTFLNAFFQIFTTKRVVEKIVDRAEGKFRRFSEFLASFAELMKTGEAKKLSSCLDIEMREQITYNITKFGAIESLKLLGYQRVAILPEEQLLREDFLS